MSRFRGRNARVILLSFYCISLVLIKSVLIKPVLIKYVFGIIFIYHLSREFSFTSLHLLLWKIWKMFDSLQKEILGVLPFGHGIIRNLMTQKKKNIQPQRLILHLTKQKIKVSLITITVIANNQRKEWTFIHIYVF